MSLELRMLPDFPFSVKRDKFLADQLKAFLEQQAEENRWDERLLQLSFDSKKNVFILRIHADYCPQSKVAEMTERLRKSVKASLNIRSAHQIVQFSEWLVRGGLQEPEDEAIAKLHYGLARL